MNKHRDKCNVLKKIRKSIADKLGIDLHQRECTFEGTCKGTCPKCKQEEDILNKEIAKRAGALALGATASLMLTACGAIGNTTTGVPPLPEDELGTESEVTAVEDEYAGAPTMDGVDDELPLIDDEIVSVADATLGEPIVDDETQPGADDEVTPGELPYDGED